MSVASGFRRNAEVLWDRFSPTFYKNKNYAHLRDDDRQILTHMRDFFAKFDLSGGRGIDVGTGPNLYPLMALLPFCDKVTLLDISHANIEWLRNEIKNPGRSWDEFWRALTRNGAYRRFGRFRDHLERAVIEQGDLFNLPTATYDIGTMFFVAESLTEDRDEFTEAVHCFVGSLKQGAPFAIAFMRGSEGYQVDKENYPAVAITEIDVQQCLEAVAKPLSIMEVPLVDPIRKGYEGMMLATGQAAHGLWDGGPDDEASAPAQPPRDLARPGRDVFPRR